MGDIRRPTSPLVGFKGGSDLPIPGLALVFPGRGTPRLALEPVVVPAVRYLQHPAHRPYFEFLVMALHEGVLRFGSLTKTLPPLLVSQLPSEPRLVRVSNIHSPQLIAAPDPPGFAVVGFGSASYTIAKRAFPIVGRLSAPRPVCQIQCLSLVFVTIAVPACFLA